MPENTDRSDAASGKHASARLMAERALRAQAAGADEAADRLFAEAERIDADAVVAVLQERKGDAPRAVDTEEQDDDEIAALSRTVQPEADAPSRANISDRGSGADNG